MTDFANFTINCRFWPTRSRFAYVLATILAVISVPSIVLNAAPEVNFKKIEPVLKNYCYDCHADGVNKGEVAFDEYTNLTTHLSNQKLWLPVWQNLQSQM